MKKICHENREWTEKQGENTFYFRSTWCGQRRFSEEPPEPKDPEIKPQPEMPWDPYWDDPKNHCKKCLKAREAAGKPYAFKLKVVPSGV